MGRPLGDVLDVGLLVQAVPRLTTATAWTLTTVVALLVLAGSRTVLSWGWTAFVFGVALLGPLPVALTGHSATGGSHDIASDSLVLHVLAASLWIGGLVAVLALATGGDGPRPALATAVPRYSRTALACWLVVGATGVVNALVRVAPADLSPPPTARSSWERPWRWPSGRARPAHRRRTVGPAAAGRPGALVRSGAVEVVVMLATVGLAVALGRSAPPRRTRHRRPGPRCSSGTTSRPADGVATPVRLAVQPAVRFRRDRAGGALRGGGATVAEAG